MKLSLVICFALVGIVPTSAVASQWRMDDCSNLHVEIVRVEGEGGKELGIFRIANSGGVPVKFDLAGVDGSKGLPLLSGSSYLLRTRGSASSSWSGAHMIGTFSAPKERLIIEPGSSVLVGVNVARAYEQHDEAGEALYMEVFTRDPVCKAESDPVRVADVPRQLASGE